jgi:hypothetical protein
MSTDIGESGVPYGNVQIPTLEDDADIRAALRTYHFGANVSDPTDTQEAIDNFPHSIAGELQSLQNTKRDIAVESILGAVDLDTKTTPGSYFVSQSAAIAGSNYPIIGGSRRAGFLTVESVGSGSNMVVTQTYTIVDSISAINQAIFVRSRINGVWAPASWRRLSDEDHNHDNIYTRSTTIDTALSEKVTQVNGKSSDTQTLSGTRKIIVARPITVNGVDIPDITQAQRDSLQPGDIWFW